MSLEKLHILVALLSADGGIWLSGFTLYSAAATTIHILSCSLMCIIFLVSKAFQFVISATECYKRGWNHPKKNIEW